MHSAAELGHLSCRNRMQEGRPARFFLGSLFHAKNGIAKNGAGDSC